MDYTHIRLSALNTVDLAIQGAKHDDVFILKGADGLGPAEIDVSIAQGLGGGGYFQNKVPRNKQIILRIGLNPSWSALGSNASDLRELLYGTLTGGYAGDKVAVQLITKNLTTGVFVSETCRIYGYISKFEIVPFSKDPQVQLTIDCLSPYFASEDLVTPDLGVLDKATPNIVNVGTGPTGFYMKFTFAGLPVGGIDWFEITAQDGLRKMRWEPPSGFVNGESIEFHTQEGQRFATLGGDINGNAWMSSDSEWLQLHGGLNVLSMSTNLFNWNSLSFYPKYWGV